MENRKEKTFSLFGKVSFVLFLLFAGFISWAIFKQVNKKQAVQKEIVALQEEAQRISRENTLAQERISYFESQDYKEREAKEKLNLKSPEENVVIVKTNVTKKEVIPEAPMEVAITKNQSPNPVKWFQYFFQHE